MGDFCTDAYLTPHINRAYGAELTTLQSDADSSFIERIRDIPAVPIGTTDLSIYQADQMPGGNQKGPLCGISTAPVTVEWKTVGQPDECYVEAARTGKIPYVTPNSGGIAGSPFNPFCMMWEWRGGIIYVTPLTYPADFRVRGDFFMTPLVQDTDKLGVHPTMYLATAFHAAALVGGERNNAGWKEYKVDGDDQLVHIENILVKAEQGTTTRLGRVGGRGNGSGGTFGNGG